MRKRRMRLSESKLHSIVRDTVRGVLREGSTEDEVAYKWDEVEELLGSNEMCNAIFNALSKDELIDILEYLTWLSSHKMCDAIFHALRKDKIMDILESLSSTEDI